MLKSVIKKILGFFSVTQTEREIENVEYGSGTGWTVLKVYGREVYVTRRTSKEDGVTVYTIDLSKSTYVKFKPDLSNRSGHGQPAPHFEWSNEFLSEKDHEALVKDFFRQEEDYARLKKEGQEINFRRKLIRLYPPRPTEDAGSHPQVKSDAQPR